MSANCFSYWGTLSPISRNGSSLDPMGDFIPPDLLGYSPSKSQFVALPLNPVYTPQNRKSLCIYFQTCRTRIAMAYT